MSDTTRSPESDYLPRRADPAGPDLCRQSSGRRHRHPVVDPTDASDVTDVLMADGNPHSTDPSRAEIRIRTGFPLRPFPRPAQR
ncbi:hypothetical protein ACH4GP_08025 [Streptomyces celluloflavus]|uniref:Uncharacterized protein n=1 Tax=Streptomyces celluloflavus TaxID=58344 RepID=A0ABW7R8F3_9ACTN